MNKQTSEEFMSENITGVIEKLEVQGPFEGKNGKPDYDRHLFTISGVKLTKLANIGIEPEFQEGDNVHAFFKQTVNGKFTNNYIIKLEKSTGYAKQSSSKKVNKDDTPPFKVESTSATVNTIKTQVNAPVTSKDISMEVSGLLQALIHTGHFTVNETNSLDVEKITKALSEALRLKRKVAKELEQKGTV